MNPTTSAVRAGLIRGRIEFHQLVTTPQDLWSTVLPSVIYLVVLFFTRGSTVPGTDFSLGSRTLPGLLGMVVVSSSMGDSV